MYTLGMGREKREQQEKVSAGRRETGGEGIMKHRVLLLYTHFYIPSMHIYEHVLWKIAFLGTLYHHL